MIEAATSAAGHMGHDAVEHFAMRFVFVEPVVDERPQKAAALRNTKGDRTRDGAAGNGQLRDRIELELRHGIADRRWSESDDSGVDRLVDDLVDVPRRRAGEQSSVSPVLREFPLVVRDEATRTLDALANGQ